jgi:hypothetical protein
LQLVAAKISKPKFLENGGNSLNFSKVFFQSGMWWFESSQVSQPVRRLEILPLVTPEMPPMAGFCDSAVGLQAPNLATSGTKSPIVSGGYLKHSRFGRRRTETGFVPTLRDGRGSAISLY